MSAHSLSCKGKEIVAITELEPLDSDSRLYDQSEMTQILEESSANLHTTDIGQ